MVDKALQRGVIYLDRVVKDRLWLPLLLDVSSTNVVNQDDDVLIVIGDGDAVLVDQVPDLLVQGHCPHAAAQLLRHGIRDLPAEAAVVRRSVGVGPLGGCRPSPYLSPSPVSRAASETENLQTIKGKINSRMQKMLAWKFHNLL